MADFGRAALFFAALALLVSHIAPAIAQTYPTHTIRLIVPFPAGGSNDVMARIIAPHLEQALGQTVIVDNRPAAGGIVGSDAVAKAPPDGHTLLLVASSHTVTPALNSKLPYNTEKDFAPLSLINTNAMVFFDNPKVPAKTLVEFIALAKKNPGKFNYSSPGAGSQTHLTVELLSNRAGIKMQHIPYRGGAPATLAVISGEAEFTLARPECDLPAHRGRHHPPDRERRRDAPSAPAERADHGRIWLCRHPGDPMGRHVHHRRHAAADRRSPQCRAQPHHPPARDGGALRRTGRHAHRKHARGIRKLIANEIREWTEMVREANIKVE